MRRYVNISSPPALQILENAQMAIARAAGADCLLRLRGVPEHLILPQNALPSSDQTAIGSVPGWEITIHTTDSFDTAQCGLECVQYRDQQKLFFLYRIDVTDNAAWIGSGFLRGIFTGFATLSSTPETIAVRLKEHLEQSEVPIAFSGLVMKFVPNSELIEFSEVGRNGEGLLFIHRDEKSDISLLRPIQPERIATELLGAGTVFITTAQPSLLQNEMTVSSRPANPIDDLENVARILASPLPACSLRIRRASPNAAPGREKRDL